MKFVVENEAFARAIALVKSCVPARATIPILGHVIVEAKASSIVVRASNLERETEATVAAEVSEPGSVALPGEVLAGLARKLTKGGQLEVSTKDDRAKAVSGSSKYDLRTLPAVDFPMRKTVGEDAVTFTIPGKTLRSLLQSTVYATALKDDRLFCQGVNLVTEGNQLIAVGTDGLRIAIMTIELPQGAAKMPAATLPQESCRTVCDLIGEDQSDVELAVSASLLELRLEGCRFASGLLNFTLPANWSKFIPAKGKVATAATFRPYVLSEAVDRACVVFLSERDTKNRWPTIECEAKDGNIHLSAGRRGSEQAAEIVEAETNGHSAAFKVPAEHVVEMLAMWSESSSVEMSQEKPGKPIVFESSQQPEMRHAIMPLTIGDDTQ